MLLAPDAARKVVVCYFFFFFFGSVGAPACALLVLADCFFLYLVFLPFFSLGKSLRTASISSSVQACTVDNPACTTFGAGIFPRMMYRLSVEAASPSFFAASFVESIRV